MGKVKRALGDALRERGHTAAVEAVINPAVTGLAEHVGIARARVLLEWSRASHYRAPQPVMLGRRASARQP